MDTNAYTALSRQTGLRRELDIIANNVANANTNGFRREDLVFSEFVKSAGAQAPSLSMVEANAHRIVLDQAGIEITGGTFDFAIQGPGFFQIERDGNTFLTRAGHFMPGQDGLLVNGDGHQLLDAGGAPVFVPPGTEVALASDGTLSADGRPIALIGLMQPVDELDLERGGGNLFAVRGELEPVDGIHLVQGALEKSNVNPIAEIARLIEVQRQYESTKGFLDREDQRIKSVIQTLGRS